jgi:S-adenosyl methyltransferase
VTAAFARALAPGSYLIISVGSGNPAEGDNFTSACTAAQLCIHPLDDIVSFFSGLELVPPGVVPVMCRNGDGAPLDHWPRTATFLGGVAGKS